jgi:hypothetical protein
MHNKVMHSSPSDRNYFQFGVGFFGRRSGILRQVAITIFNAGRAGVRREAERYSTRSKPRGGTSEFLARHASGTPGAHTDLSRAGFSGHESDKAAA